MLYPFADVLAGVVWANIDGMRAAEDGSRDVWSRA